jgi:hypothetical protein
LTVPVAIEIHLLHCSGTGRGARLRIRYSLGLPPEGSSESCATLAA